MQGGGGRTWNARSVCCCSLAGFSLLRHCAVVHRHWKHNIESVWCSNRRLGRCHANTCVKGEIHHLSVNQVSRSRTQAIRAGGKVPFKQRPIKLRGSEEFNVTNGEKGHLLPAYPAQKTSNDCKLAKNRLATDNGGVMPKLVVFWIETSWAGNYWNRKQSHPLVDHHASASLDICCTEHSGGH